jgi:hypothetical protein
MYRAIPIEIPTTVRELLSFLDQSDLAANRTYSVGFIP